MKNRAVYADYLKISTTVIYTKAWRLIFSLFFVIQGCATYGMDTRNKHNINEIRAEIAVTADIQKMDSGKELFDGITVLDIDTAVMIALADNPGLSSMSERVKEAIEKYPVVTALDDPMMGIGFYPETFGSNRNDFAYTIEFKQKIPYLGKIDLKGARVIAEAKVALDKLNSVRLDLIRAVKTAYLELFFSRRAMAINEEDKRLLHKFKTIAKSRYAVGKGRFQDIVQADVAIAKVEFRKISLKRSLRVAMARLNTLMGRSAWLSILPSVTLPSTASLPVKKTLIKKAISDNPEIKAAYSRIEAAKASVKLAQLRNRPDFIFTGAYNKAWMNENLRPFIGVSLNIPLQFDLLKAENNIALAKLNRSKRDLKAVKDRVRFQVEEGWQKLEESRNAKKLFQNRLIPEVELNLNAAHTGYIGEKNDFLTLITAQRALLDVRFQYERISVDLRIREAELFRAVGEE